MGVWFVGLSRKPRFPVGVQEKQNDKGALLVLGHGNTALVPAVLAWDGHGLPAARRSDDGSAWRDPFGGVGRAGPSWVSVGG